MSGHEKNGIPFLVICIALSAALFFFSWRGFGKICENPVGQIITRPLAILMGVPAGGDPKAKGWEKVNERWVRNYYRDGSVTMSDRKKGIMWFYDAENCGYVFNGDLPAFLDKLTYSGYSDWELPSRDMLFGMMSEIQFFIIPERGATYWTSTPVAATWYTVNVRSGSVRDDASGMGIRLPYSQYRERVWPCRRFK